MSSILSASSSTRYCTLSSGITGGLVSASRSLKRPGVPMMMWIPNMQLRICGPLGMPPYTHADAILDACPNLVHSASICTASSRVGARQTATGPSPRRGVRLTDLRMSMKAGNRKPHVLPLPVLATAIRSLPALSTGQPWAWMAEGVVKPAFLTMEMSSGLRPASSKRWQGGGQSPPETVTSCTLRHSAAERSSGSADAAAAASPSSPLRFFLGASSSFFGVCALRLPALSPASSLSSSLLESSFFAFFVFLAAFFSSSFLFLPLDAAFSSSLSLLSSELESAARFFATFLTAFFFGFLVSSSLSLPLLSDISFFPFFADAAAFALGFGASLSLSSLLLSSFFAFLFLASFIFFFAASFFCLSTFTSSSESEEESDSTAFLLFLPLTMISSDRSIRIPFP
mmetsp:Transcript_24564/g.58921  ORF Transcript_24564/g.58921 Transcript_24564/m.58921 type:complete len:400 (+) Transcript_24564:726-1925(+)